jgi:hypothetical protein
MMWHRLVAIAGVLLLSRMGFSFAFADEFAAQQDALGVIGKTAIDICNQVDQQGSRSSLQLSGQAQAALDNAIAKLTELKIAGAGDYRTEQYKGVLQQDLAATLKSNMDCKLAVFNTLVSKMLGWTPPKSETIRRNILIGKLCQEYILSYDGLSPALLAGTEPVSADWMNKRLEQMGEAWRVRVKGTQYEILSVNNP